MDNLPLDNTENPETTPQPEYNDLQEQCASLRQVVHTLLVLVLILSGALNIYFLRQVRNARTELNGMQRMIGGYNEFVTRIVDYGRTHADFQPILAKYGIQIGTGTNAPAPAPSPATSSPAPAAKKK